MGVKRDFGYNFILTICNYIFPLLTYPYVSRILGVTNIGICNFVDSIINYFILFSMLGVGSYGVREIAKWKNDQQKLNEVFSNLFLVNVLMTIVSTVLLVACTYSIQSLAPYKSFIGFGIVKLVFNLFLIEWFFQGIQQFKYITIRSIIVRCIYVVTIFIFVRTQEDSIIYYGLTSLTIVLNAILNWNYSRKFKTFSFNNIQLKLYIVPILVFGYYRILTSMYTTFNTTFLGFTLGDTEVGYFTTATKLYSIVMAAFTAFTTVMVPRVSQLIKEGNHEKIQQIANDSISALVLLTIPLILFCEILAPYIIYIIAGVGYEGAITPFRIVIFLLLIIGMEQIVIQQFLMASNNNNKSILKLSTYGAFVGITINILITPYWGAIGSSIAWGCSEIVVLLFGIHMLKKHMDIMVNIHTIDIKSTLHKFLPKF